MNNESLLGCSQPMKQLVEPLEWDGARMVKLTSAIVDVLMVVKMKHIVVKGNSEK